MIKVCSGFSPSGFAQYGQRFLDTFDPNWPASTQLEVYVEEWTTVPRQGCRSLWTIPGAESFHQRHCDNLAAQGRAAQPCWKAKEIAAGYSFRTDAYKFWKQILIPEASAGGMDDGDILVWIDADVVTLAPVPEDFVPRLIGNAEVAFLKREPKHSEIGFWAVRLNSRTRLFLQAIADVYRSDQVFALPQWHSAFVWDHVRRQFALEERSLTKPGTFGHVWPMSPLGRYMRHDKGGRKTR